MEEFYNFVDGDFLVGVEFGGSILASMYGSENLKFAIIRKDGTIYGSPIPKRFVLLDDVVTTENSIRSASKLLSNIGHYYDEIKCVVDRRKEENKSLHIESMLECNK
jgi:orotate phosphoribosyltransferase